MIEPEQPRNRAERRRAARLNGSGLWVAGDSAEPAAPAGTPPVTAGELQPMTPELARAELDRQAEMARMMDWRRVELWMLVVIHFGPAAWGAAPEPARTFDPNDWRPFHGPTTLDYGW